MKIHFVILVFIFTICAIASQSFAQEKPKTTPTQQTPQRSMREIVMLPVVYRVAGMDKVKVKSDLKYTDVNNPNLLMDVYSPPNPVKG